MLIERTISRFDRAMLLLSIAGAGLAVAFGAFGAHALKHHLSERMLEVFDTGVRYQMFHTLGLMILTTLVITHPSRFRFRLARSTMLAGLIIFSGSLYCLVLSGITLWGMITPIGGVLLLFAWFVAGFEVYRLSSEKKV